MPKLTTRSLLIRLWQHLNRRRRFQFVLVFVLILISAIAEAISLGAVLPFIGVLAAPNEVFSYPAVGWFATVLGISSASDLMLPFTVAFAVSAVFAGIIRILLLRSSTRLAYATGADLSIDVYRRTLYQPYQVHIARNSSTVISGMTQKIGNATSVLMSVLTLMSSVVLIAVVTLALLVISAPVAILAVIAFGSSYGAITWVSRRRLAHNSQRIAHESTRVIKALQEGLGGIRDVLLGGSQPIYCGIYRESQLPLMRTQAENVFIGARPRYFMEALSLVLIAALAFGLSRQPGGIASALPVLGVLALGGQRLLPALQQAYGAWASIVGNQASLADALELLDQPLPMEVNQPPPVPLVLRHAVRFDGVRFRYSIDGPWVLDGLDLTIPKGGRFGFVGATGSGKSTALDLVMGLLAPTQGRVLVDGESITGERLRAWQRAVAHVPQSIYLADITVAENIALGEPIERIDMNRVRKAANQAQIADFVDALPGGYRALVGERGIRLSGGQRQRIGIARALYREASVLVLDEATSALDNATERAVMDAIQNFNRDLTILLIAHRLTTVQLCDTIVELEEGRIVAQGSYEELLEHSPSFRKLASMLSGSAPARLGKSLAGPVVAVPNEP